MFKDFLNEWIIDGINCKRIGEKDTKLQKNFFAELSVPCLVPPKHWLAVSAVNSMPVPQPRRFA